MNLRVGGGVGILVKTPGLSPIKTRLAARVGTERATEFHRLACDWIGETVGALPGVQGYWSVAEPHASAHWAHFPSLWQGHGTFGARLHHTYRSVLLRHRFALILAPDSPHVSRSVLERACHTLARKPGFVLGPARDGGFYLMGGNLPLRRSVWERIPYSTEHAGLALRKELENVGPVAPAPLLTDVDEWEDLGALQKEWLDPPPRLVEWMKGALGHHTPV